jgi:hypothetical protein
MARTQGALNKRTRAALHAAKCGELGGGGESPVDYLLRVMRDSKKADELRIEAAKAVAPYLTPKLSAVEVNGQFDDDERLTDADILGKLKSLLIEHPEILEQVAVNSSLTAPTAYTHLPRTLIEEERHDSSRRTCRTNGRLQCE